MPSTRAHKLTEPQTAIRSFTPYSPRTVCFGGIRELHGYRLKLYSILYADRSHDPQLLESALGSAAAAIPSPAVTSERPGVGFAILHLGRTADYFILAWWDRENELPMSIFVNAPSGWRSAQAGESVCVWDLRVLWHEREAYVATILNRGPNSVADYLARTFQGHA